MPCRMGILKRREGWKKNCVTHIRLQDNSEKVLARPTGSIWAQVGPLRSPIGVEFAWFLLFHHVQYLVRSILGKVSKLKGVRVYFFFL